MREENETTDASVLILGYRTVCTYGPLNGKSLDQKPRSIQWDLQFITFVTSMVFQLATLILSAISLSKSGNPNPAPPLLTVVVTLELIVQVVELLWYGIVGSLYYFGMLSIGVRYRYYDWVVTTPVGLIGLIIFIWFLECQSATTDILSDGSRITAIVVIVIFDWLMLFVGYVYEAELDLRNTLNELVSCVPFGQPRNSDRYSIYQVRGLFLGWIPFVGIFIPMFVALAAASQSDSIAWGWFTIVFTFVTWALYGVVAIYWRRPEDAPMKNTCYNLLDIVSKNIVGLVTSIIAFNLSTSEQSQSWQDVTCGVNTSN